MRRLAIALLAAAMPWLAGCDQLGLESASQAAARREAEGKAVGGGCRQAARSIEVCYEQNKRADKAAVFAGWREMNDYMRENKLEAMPAADAGTERAEGAAKGEPSDRDAQGADRGNGDEPKKAAKPAAKVAAAKADDSRR